jgi:hypothetical protein
MGTWGDGNLQNDGALDALATISEELFVRVIELLKHPNGYKYDCEEIGELFVRIEMIVALHKKGLISAPPQKIDLEPLFEEYLNNWEAYFERGAPRKRRKVIEKTFGRLMKVVQKLHKEEGTWVEVPFDPDDPNDKKMMEVFDAVERRQASNSDENQ